MPCVTLSHDLPGSHLGKRLVGPAREFAYSDHIQEDLWQP